jgi:hypothetical protein
MSSPSSPFGLEDLKCQDIRKAEEREEKSANSVSNA